MHSFPSRLLRPAVFGAIFGIAFPAAPQLRRSSPPATQQAAAEPQQAGTFLDITYTEPGGWSPGRQDADSRSYLKRTRDGGSFVLILAEKPLVGDLSTSFRSVVQQSFPGTGLRLQNIQSGHTADGRAAISLRDGGNLRQNNRYAQVRAVGIATPSNKLLFLELFSISDIGALIDREHEFESFVRSVRFTGATAHHWSPLEPPPGSGGKRGVLWSVRMQNQLNPLGGMNLLAIRDYLILLPGGQALTALPSDGRLTDPDLRALIAAHPQAVGTYRVSGSTLSFAFPNEYGFLSESTGTVEGDNAGVRWNGGTYVPLRPVQNLHLNGRWSSTFAMTGNGTSVSSTHTIAFTLDGRYARTGGANASGPAYAVGSRGGVNQGTYSIDGYTLTLTPAGGGPPERSTIIFETVSSSPKALWINDNTYLK